MKNPVVFSVGGALLLTGALVVALWPETGSSPPSDLTATETESVAHAKNESAPPEVAPVKTDPEKPGKTAPQEVQAPAPPVEDVRGFGDEELRDFQADRKERLEIGEVFFRKLDARLERASENDGLALEGIVNGFRKRMKVGVVPGQRREPFEGEFLRQLFTGDWKGAWPREYERGWHAVIETITASELDGIQKREVNRLVWEAYDAGKTVCAEVEADLIGPDDEFGGPAYDEAWQVEIEAFQPIFEVLAHKLISTLSEDQRPRFEEFLAVCQLTY